MASASPAAPRRRGSAGSGAAATSAASEVVPVPSTSEPILPEDDFASLLEQEAKEQPVADGETKVVPSRHSPMSVGKYNQWMLVDANRRLGVAIRAEEAALQRRREASTAAYHEARTKKTSVGRGQQEMTANSVREYRGGLAKAGEQGRSELMSLRAIALRQKKEWAAHGARNAARLGLEQKKRVLEARAERFQTRRNAALQTKTENAARKSTAQSLTAAHLEDKKTRLDRVRENTPDAASLAEAREFFQKQKREAAAAVRSEVRGWESARNADKASLIAKATATRNVVIATRQKAAQKREAIKEGRTAMAAKIRAALEEMEDGRRERIERSRQQAEVAHRELYERKFVDDESAAKVDESEYGQLVSTTRAPGGSSTSASALHVASSASSPSRSPDTKPIPMPSWAGYAAPVQRGSRRSAARDKAAASTGPPVAAAPSPADDGWTVTDLDGGEGPTC